MAFSLFLIALLLLVTMEAFYRSDAIIGLIDHLLLLRTLSNWNRCAIRTINYKH